jgi:uncharacterized protein YggL (DUF469 family)
MKKRLRKKKGLKEFQVAGFEFFANYKCEDMDILMSTFSAITHSHKVNFYGHCCDCDEDDCGDHIEGLVIAGTVCDPVKERREAFLAELTEKLALTNVKAGEWVDVNYADRPVRLKD